MTLVLAVKFQNLSSNFPLHMSLTALLTTDITYPMYQHYVYIVTDIVCNVGRKRTIHYSAVIQSTCV